MKKVIISLILFIVFISISSISTAMSHYQIVGTTTGLVTASALNVRQGPGTNYKIVTMIYKNEYIRIFAKIGDWYVIQTDGDYIGMVSSKYVKLIYPTKGASDEQENNTPSQNTSGLTRR